LFQLDRSRCKILADDVGESSGSQPSTLRQTLQVGDDVVYLLLRMSGHVFFESQTEDYHGGALDWFAYVSDALDDHLAHMDRHGIVDLASRENHLRLIAELLGAVGEIVRIDADAMSTDEAGVILVEIPFCARRRQDFLGVEPEMPRK